MMEYGTGDNPVVGKDGTVWIEVAFFIGERGTGDRRGIKLPDGTIKEYNE